MDDAFYYVKRRYLRDIGYVQPDEVFMPFLAKINQQVEQDIDREARMNMNQTDLRDYTRILEGQTLSSPVVQSWLKQHVPDIDSIVVDRVNIALARLQAQNSGLPEQVRQ